MGCPLLRAKVDRPSVDLGQRQRSFGAHTLCSAAPEAAPVTFQFRKREEVPHASEEASFDQVSDSYRDCC